MTSQVSATLLPNGKQQFFSAAGVPLAGGSVYFYIPTTTTPKTTWVDAYQLVPNANPVVLDAAGEAIIYGSGQYRQVVFDALSNLIWDQLTTDILYLVNIPATTRTRLSGNANYYVATTGSDANPGTIGSPWLTIQHALNFIQSSVDLNQFSATVNVADGTYTGGVSVGQPFFGGGQVFLIGNAGIPANCTISTTSADAIGATENCDLFVQGFTLQTTTSGIGLNAINGGTIKVNGPMVFGACASGQVEAFGPGSLVSLQSNYTISGSSTSHWSTGDGGSITASGLTLTLTGTPAYSNFFAFADTNSSVIAAGVTFSGSATGPRYGVSRNGVLVAGTNSLTYFPGSSVGSQNSGGIYNSLLDPSIALLASPNFTGVPTAPTAAINTSTTQLATTAFANPGSSIAATGYVKLPNGSILQWGVNVSTVSGTQSFPLTFPTAVYSVSVTAINTGTGNAISVNSAATTGFVFVVPAAESFYWSAVGA